jgi:hypothetical protein
VQGDARARIGPLKHDLGRRPELVFQTSKIKLTIRQTATFDASERTDPAQRRRSRSEGSVGVTQSLTPAAGVGPASTTLRATRRVAASSWGSGNTPTNNFAVCARNDFTRHCAIEHHKKHTPTTQTNDERLNNTQ